MASVRIVRWIDLEGIQRGMLSGAEDGVNAAVQESVSWIKNDVLLDQGFVGKSHFPDVTPATKRAKRKKGNNKVLIDIGHYKDSWIGEANGLEGKIHCGTDGYFADIHKKWRIDKLWKEFHSKEALEIIEKAIKRRI